MVISAGGTGGIHHLIHNYTEPGDEVLTADWYWGAYRVICSDTGRTLVTYSLFDEHNNFNHEAFQNRVNELAAKQTNVIVIFNTPGNNPTGYSIEDKDWDSILNFSKKMRYVRSSINLVIYQKKFSPVCVIAYLKDLLCMVSALVR